MNEGPWWVLVACLLLIHIPVTTAQPEAPPTTADVLADNEGDVAVSSDVAEQDDPTDTYKHLDLVAASVLEEADRFLITVQVADLASATEPAMTDGLAIALEWIDNDQAYPLSSTGAWARMRCTGWSSRASTCRRPSGAPSGPAAAPTGPKWTAAPTPCPSGWTGPSSSTAEAQGRFLAAPSRPSGPPSSPGPRRCLRQGIRRPRRRLRQGTRGPPLHRRRAKKCPSWNTPAGHSGPYVRGAPMAAPMVQGTIARYIPDKGFGFINTDASDEDVFFHMSAFAGDNEPREGQAVEFEIEQSDRGPRAANVRAV